MTLPNDFADVLNWALSISLICAFLPSQLINKRLIICKVNLRLFHVISRLKIALYFTVRGEGTTIAKKNPLTWTHNGSRVDENRASRRYYA
jgi:hypothetical protein